MAKRQNNGYRNSTRKSKSSNSKFSNLERLAYNFGRIQAGLKEDTRVKDSYENGLNSKNREKTKSKPLY